MTRIAYFDCFSGCSGDMLLGSLLDAGLPLEILQNALSGLDISGYRLSVEKVRRSSIAAAKFNVTLDPDVHQHHRGLTDILAIIGSGRLSAEVKEKSTAVFRRLGEVEARVHGIPLEEVHFHELGAIDTIIDIVGTIFSLDHLKISRCYSSPLPAGSGRISAAHGILPAPAPATLQILAEAGAPLTAAPDPSVPPGELVTPTGAVLVTFTGRFPQAGYDAGKNRVWHRQQRL